jgi:hypothetical protein
MAASWIEKPNPVSICCDLPNAKNSWSYICSKLRENDIEVWKIDFELYHELTVRCDTRDLARKIQEVKVWSDDGTLDARFTAWQQAQAIQAESASASCIDAASNAGLYTKRFTHVAAHGHARAGGAASERLAEKNNAGTTQSARKKANKSKRRGRLFAAFCLFLVFGAVVGSILWAMGTHQWDFTAAGAVG